MQINNLYLSHLAVNPPAAQTAAETASKESAAASPLAESSSHTLSPELLRLISLAQAQPEVRPEAVQQARTSLAQGVYASAASADQTAHAILNAAE
jgi:hypothetical protein